jgi:hypothetical protein
MATSAYTATPHRVTRQISTTSVDADLSDTPRPDLPLVDHARPAATIRQIASRSSAVDLYPRTTPRAPDGLGWMVAASSHSAAMLQ